MKQYDLLVIDDEEVIIDFFIKISEAENLFIDTAKYGKIAFDKLINNSYKLIVCDLILPDLSGFDILNKIRSQHITTPVIITSGYSTIENAIKALKSGAIDFLPKPFTFDEVLCCLKRGLNYSKILTQQIEGSVEENDSELLFIPCPPSYYRFGLSTWIKIEQNDLVIAGLTDLTMRTISKLDALNLTNVNDEVEQGKEFLTMNCDLGLLHKILAPLSGSIIEVNQEVLNNPSIVEKDPFFEGWVYKIQPSNLTNEMPFLTSCSTDRF
jgi:YesN/AraC family two-component response regulator